MGITLELYNSHTSKSRLIYILSYYTYKILDKSDMRNLR